MTPERATATFQMPGAAVSTLKCSACSNRACQLLGEVPGVEKVDCSSGSEVRVEFDPERVSEADLSVEMERFGLQLAESFHHLAWRVIGLD